MSITIGIVGPEDLVQRVAAAEADIHAELVGLPYRHESETVGVLEATGPDVDAVLFTGVVPYIIAADAGALTIPAMYVPYDGATLLRALVELLRLGHDVSRISIDTLRRAEVMETFTEAKLPTDQVHVLPHRADLTSDDIAAFHRSTRARHDTRVAITCLGSAFNLIEHEMHAIRLAPSRYSIRSTLQALALTTTRRQAGDAQVALGLIELPGPDERLADDLVVFGASLAQLADHRHLVVTTRGLLEQATVQFTRLPLLDRLAQRHPTARVGFGVGRTAAEAESLARRAVVRAGAVGTVAAVVSTTDDVDIVIEPGATSIGPDTAVSLPMLARRVGLSPATLERLRDLQESELTTHDLAEHLNIQQRSARRTLKRLERAGLAVPTGSLPQGRTGRPPIVYRLNLNPRRCG